MDDASYFGFFRNDGTLKRRAPTSFLLYNKLEYKKFKDDPSSTLTNESKVDIGQQWKDLPEEEQKKFVDEATSAKELLNKLKALDPPMAPRPTKSKIQTRIALKQITEIVCQFSEEQRTAVKAIGLGGILELSCTKLKHEICDWLVNNFDPDSHSLTVHGRTFLMTESHVEECLGINGQGEIVSMNSSEGYVEVCKDLGVTKGFVDFRILVKYLLKAKVADEDFKRKFALYILGSFLCPTTKPGIHESLIPLVTDVHAMENVNWARITLDFLCNAIRVQRAKHRPHANGCLFLLLLFYLERVSPTGFQMRPRNPCLVVWGDRQINDVLRQFKRNGGYMKEGVRVNFMMDEESVGNGKGKTNGKDSRSHQIPNVDIAELTSSLNNVAGLLERQTVIMERQTRVFERYFGVERATNQHEGAKIHQVPIKFPVQLNQNTRSPYTGGRMSTPRPFQTHEGADDLMEGQGDGTEDRKYGPIFSANEYAGFGSTPQGKTHTLKRNNEDGIDGDPFSPTPSPSPLSGFKPKVALSRGRKRKMTNTNLRRSLRLSDYQPPELRPRAELKKSQLISSPYTRDVPKKRNPIKKPVGAQSPIDVDDEKLDGNFPIIGGLLNHLKSTKFHAPYHLAKLNPETKSYLSPYYTTNPRPMPLTAEEELLKNFIFDPSRQFTFDPYVHILLLGRDRDFALRIDLCSLKPKEWICDTIINLVAIQLTNAERLKHPDKRHMTWYFPVVLARKMLQEPIPTETELKRLCRTYFGDHQFTGDLSSCTSIYIPLNSNNSHWICIKVDMAKQMTYLFDSMPCGHSNSVRLNLASRLMGVLDQMMSLQYGDLYQHKFSTFKIVNWERQPLQHYTDTYDCGLFVIKFMQGVDYPPGVHMMDDNERPRLLMDLIYDANNWAKAFVFAKFDEWKGT